MNYIEFVNSVRVGDYFNFSYSNGVAHEGIIIGRKSNTIFYVNAITNSNGNYVHSFNAMYLPRGLVVIPYGQWNNEELNSIFNSSVREELRNKVLADISPSLKEVERKFTNQLELLQAENEGLKHHIEALNKEILILKANQKPLSLKARLKQWLVGKLTN